MSDDHAKQSTDNNSGQNKGKDEELHRALLHSSNPAFHTLTSMGLTGEIKPTAVKSTELESETEILEKKNRIEDDPVSSDEKSQIKGSDVPPGELSDFSQWLSTLATPVLPVVRDIIVAEETKPNKETGTVPPQAVKQIKTDQLPDANKEGLSAVKSQKKRKKRKKSKKRHKKPNDSGVVLSDDIFSETLADLLAKQGHVKQAVHMYKKMGLIYPEKSRFFAVKIEELNKKG